MYRTYRELYRGKVEIISLGVGAGKIRLPRGISLGIDTIALAALATIIVGLPAGKLIQIVMPPTRWGELFNILLPPIIGLMIAFTVSKFDPHGKGFVRWLADWIFFLVKPKRSDGWDYPKTVRPLRLDASYFTSPNSLPVTVRADEVTLHKTLGVRVQRNGDLYITRSGKHLVQPGHYKIIDGQLVRSAPRPVIRRK